MQDDRFPAIEPYDSGMLDVGDGHQVYWECCGNLAGKPALYLSDIARLRSPSLPRGERFETLQDAREESRRSAQVLLRVNADRAADYLDDCRSEAYRCDKSSCPICARKFRRWYIGQMLEAATGSSRAYVATLLIATVARGHLTDANPARHRSLICKRLRQTIPGAQAMGCFEMVYKAQLKAWVLHINLLLIGPKQAEVDAFEKSWSGSSLKRAILIQRVKDRAKQISYVPKFTTYHRPHRQDGPIKSAAKPLNPREHQELVEWMGQYEFQDLMFLRGRRREGSEIRKTRR